MNQNTKKLTQGVRNLIRDVVSAATLCFLTANDLEKLIDQYEEDEFQIQIPLRPYFS